MFIYNKNNPLHKSPSNDAIDLHENVKCVKGLSEWESEMEEGEVITELVVGSAKPYSYTNIMKQKAKLGNVMVDKDGTAIHKTVINQEGMIMDAANSKPITFETMRDMVINNTSITSEERYTVRWGSKRKNVGTKFLSRSIVSTVNTKRTIEGFDTLPFGYEQEENKQ